MNTESPLQNKTILVVDDEPDILDILEEELDMAQVVKKTTFEDGCEYLSSNQPDLAILDIMGVNGFELLNICREKSIPAVMLTAHALTVDALKQSIDNGARAFLPKEKLADIVPFLENALTKENEESWQKLFTRLGEFFNATFGAGWNKDMIEVGAIIVPK